MLAGGTVASKVDKTVASMAVQMEHYLVDLMVVKMVELKASQKDVLMAAPMDTL